MFKLKRFFLKIKNFFQRLFCFCCLKKNTDDIIFFDNKDYSNYDPESNQFFNSNNNFSIKHNNIDYNEFESVSSNSDSSSDSTKFNSILSNTMDENEDNSHITI